MNVRILHGYGLSVHHPLSVSILPETTSVCLLSNESPTQRLNTNTIAQVSNDKAAVKLLMMRMLATIRRLYVYYTQQTKGLEILFIIIDYLFLFFYFFFLHIITHSHTKLWMK